MNKFDKTIKQIIKEEDSLDNQEPVEKPSIDNFFEFFEEIGMSAEMAIDEAIRSIQEMISSEVPASSQMTARIAVKRLWQEKIKDWRGH